MGINTLEKEVIRMELQVVELIRIVANLNKRLNKIEDVSTRRSRISKIPLTHKMK